MNWEPFKLHDGRVVTRHHRDATKGMIGSDRHDVAFDGGMVVVTDENGVEIYRGPFAPASGKGRRKAEQTATAAAGVRGGTGERFATFNMFVDLAMRHLRPTEVAVWIVLFRDCRNGVLTTSHRDIARRSGVSLRSVTDAMDVLRRTKLVEPLTLSRHKGTASTYRLTATPDACLRTLEKLSAKRTQGTVATLAPDQA